MSIQCVNDNWSMAAILDHAYQCVYNSGHLYSELIRQHISVTILPVRQLGIYTEFMGSGIEWISDNNDLTISLGSKKS